MSDIGDTRMPFGLHKGERFRDIPIRYLDWCIGEFDEGPLKQKIEAFLLNNPEWNALDTDEPVDWKEGREDAEDWRNM